MSSVFLDQLSRQYVALTQRLTVTVFDQQPVVLGVASYTSPPVNFSLSGQQAFRIIQLDAQLNDRTAATYPMKVFGFAVLVVSQNGASITNVPCRQTMGLVLGQTGLFVHLEQPTPLFFFNDDLPQGGIVGSGSLPGTGPTLIDLTAFFDIDSTLAGNNYSIFLDAIIEVYQVGTPGGFVPVGQEALGYKP